MGGRIRWGWVLLGLLVAVVAYPALRASGWLDPAEGAVQEVFATGSGPAVLRGNARTGRDLVLARPGSWETSLRGHCRVGCWVEELGERWLVLTAAQRGRHGWLVDAATGERVAELPDEVREAPWLALVDADEERAWLAWGDPVGEAHLGALSLEDGSVSWKYDDGGYGAPPSVARAGDAIAFARGGRLDLIDPATGALLDHEQADTVCAVDDQVLLMRDGVLYRYDVPERTLRLVHVAIAPEGGPVSLLGRCGIQDGAAVVALGRRRAIRAGEVREMVDVALLVALDRQAWEPRWVLDLGEATFPHSDIVLQSAAGWTHLRPGARPLVGELTRFVPVQLDGPGDMAGVVHAVLDLEEGEVAWKGDPAPAELEWFSSGVHHVLSGRLDDVGVVGVLDGTTGRFVAATAVRDPAWSPALRPSSAGEDGLWVVSERGWAELGWSDLAPRQGAARPPELAEGWDVLAESAGLPEEAAPE